MNWMRKLCGLGGYIKKLEDSIELWGIVNIILGSNKFQDDLDRVEYGETKCISIGINVKFCI